MTQSTQPQIMSVDDLFSGTLFRVPDYQRAYAWDKKQWDDLWEDIGEGMRTGTTHFLGTVVLMAREETVRDAAGRRLQVFDVVDGQQRITTLCLLLLAAFDHVREVNTTHATGIWRDFVEYEHGRRKLQLGRRNKDYFDELVSAVEDNGELPFNKSSTNKRLRRGVITLSNWMTGWLQSDKENADIITLASYVRENVQILRFVTDTRSLAVKIFQTVNDRGKEISLLDKTKSFLMFYLTRYREQDSEAFRTVESKLSEVFDNYDLVQDLAREYQVDYFVNPRFRFNEDEFLRYAYHYGYYDLRSRFDIEKEYDVWITPERIFGHFVKDSCRGLREDSDKLRDFIFAWCEDLLAVSAGLVKILERIKYSGCYKRMFQFQSPTASVYPLLVAAEARGILDEEMLNAISILDLRVYQVRGTGPMADLYRNAVKIMKTGKRNDILKEILGYCRGWGNDQEINGNLRGQVYNQYFTKYVLWSYATAQHGDDIALDHELFDNCQKEHILPQDPSTFDVTTYGFMDQEHYKSTMHGLGNLTPLEERLNKRTENRPPAEKAPIYGESRLTENQILGARIQQSKFHREEQEERGEEIVQFFKKNWAIPSNDELS